MMPTATPSWTPAPADVPRPARTRPADRYLLALSVGLLGYAMFGRAFAYLGLPPVFIGELLLGAGLAVLAFGPSRGRSLGGAPAMWIGLSLLWVTIRTVPYVGDYGLYALRDAMAAVYPLFAIVVAGLLTARPERLREVLTRYRVMVVVVGTVGWALYLLYRMNQSAFPTLPWAPHVYVIENKPGDLTVHLAGIVAFVVLGWRRTSPLLLSVLIIGSAATMAGGRGGMVGYLLGMGAFALMKPKAARFGRLVYFGVLIVMLGIAVDTSGVAINEGNRSLSVEQLWENIKSVFGESDQAMLDTTTEWRLEWWGDIVGYTFGGHYRWTGKGFGVNLATSDGYQVESDESLRSPHNAHLTYLARGGVPGLALWLLVHGSWAWVVFRSWAAARRRRLDGWMGFYAFCVVYWIAGLVNATFDVYLEGPMGAIWFWSVFGLALAGTRIQASHPHLLDDLGGAPVEPAAPAFSWAPPAEPAVPPPARPPRPSWGPITTPTGP